MCPAGKAVPYFAPGHCPDLTHGTDDPCYDKDRSMMWHNLIRRQDASKFSQRIMKQRPDIPQSWGMMKGMTINGCYEWLGYGLEDAGFKGTPGTSDFLLLRLSRLEPHIKWVPGLLPDDKLAGVWCSPPTPIHHWGLELVELYLYSRCTASCHGQRNFNFRKSVGQPVSRRDGWEFLLLSWKKGWKKWLWWSSGSVLPLSTQVRGFKPGRSHQDFSGWKNPQHAFLQKRSKAVGPMSQICGM